MKTLAESVEFEFDGHVIWAVLRANGAVVAKERVPRQWIKPDLDPELMKWYFTGIAKRLKAKMLGKPVKGANGKDLN